MALIPRKRSVTHWRHMISWSQPPYLDASCKIARYNLVAREVVRVASDPLLSVTYYSGERATCGYVVGYRMASRRLKFAVIKPTPEKQTLLVGGLRKRNGLTRIERRRGNLTSGLNTVLKAPLVATVVGYYQLLRS